MPSVPAVFPAIPAVRAAVFPAIAARFFVVFEIRAVAGPGALIGLDNALGQQSGIAQALQHFLLAPAPAHLGVDILPVVSDVLRHLGAIQPSGQRALQFFRKFFSVHNNVTDVTV